MNDFEQRLGADLRSAADHYAPSSLGLEAIKAEGHHRSTRRATRLVIGGAALTVVLVIGAVAALTRDDRSPISTKIADETGADSTLAEAPSNTQVAAPAPGSADPVLGPSAMTWRSVEVGSAEALTVGYSPPARLDDGTFLRVSTQPGRSEKPVRTLYRSDDGLSWSEIGPFPIGGSLFSASELVAAGSRVYAVGTAPAESTTPGHGLGGRPIVAVSGDAGTSWSEIPIPIDTAAIEAIPGISNVLLSANLADGPAGTVLAVQVYAYPDVASLIPGIDPNAFWQATAEGIEVGATPDCNATETTAVGTTVAEATASTVGCGSEALETHTWDELGVSAEARSYLTDGRIEMYPVGEDGTLGTPTLLPVGQASGVIGFSANELGYYLTGSTWNPNRGIPEASVWTSTDGATWMKNVMPTDGYLQSLSPWNDGLVGLVQDPSPAASLVSSSWPLAEWQQTPLDGPLAQVEASTDAVDAAWPADVEADAGGVSVLVNLSVPDVEGDGAPATSTSGPPSPGSTRTAWVVLHSTDLQTWSLEVIPELADLSDNVSVVLATVDGRTVLEVQKYNAGTGELQPKAFWIGTPNG